MRLTAHGRRLPVSLANGYPRAMTPLTVDTLRVLARLHGFDWTDAELEATRPAAEAALRVLETLRALEFGSDDPATQYRML